MTSGTADTQGPGAEAAAAEAAVADDLAYQRAILQDVSRTFALTIPQLPGRLADAVGNAYLICRIADTLEDSDALTIDEKRRFYEMFIAVVAGDADAAEFAREVPLRLTKSTLDAERDLVANTPRVVRVTHSFPEEFQRPMVRCLRIMADGMERFQEGAFVHGLRDQAHMDAYCYHVAGVVGEMLTAMFCAYSPAVAEQCEALERLAVSFGQGLQMTNILKDVWDDQARGMCWLPQTVFERHGFDLATLTRDNHGAGFEAGIVDLIAVTRGHLKDALAYTLLIPKSERGIRQFCLWALGMAVLTLRKLNRNPGFTRGDEVKISRRSVRGTVLASRLLGGNNALLKAAFRVAAAGLPRKDATEP